MDVDERSRIEVEDDKIIIILRIPIQSTDSGIPFSTIPLGIIISDDYTLILCQKKILFYRRFLILAKEK